MDLNQKIAIITGASAGLGVEFSRVLLERGAKVYGLARSIGKMEALKPELGDDFHAIACDVRDEASVKAAIQQVVDAEGGDSDRGAY